MEQNVFVIEDGTLMECRSQTTDKVVNLPAGIKVVYEGAFFNNADIEEVRFGEDCEKIEWCFAGNKSLKRVFVPKSVQKFDVRNFSTLNGVQVEIYESTYAAHPLSTKYPDLEIRWPKFSMRDHLASRVKADVDLHIIQEGEPDIFCVCHVEYMNVQMTMDLKKTVFFDKNDPNQISAYDEDVSAMPLAFQLNAAMVRLSNPTALSDANRVQYVDLLKENEAKAISACIAKDKAEWLKVLIAAEIINGGNAKKHLKAAKTKNAVGCAQVLENMDVAAKAPPKKVTAKADSKVSQTSHPIEAFAEEKAKDMNIAKILKDAAIVGMEENVLANVQYKNGATVPTEVVKYVLAAYMGQIASKPKNIGDYKTMILPVEICKDADTVAAEFEETSFLTALTAIAFGSDPTAKPQRLLPYARYASKDMVMRLIRSLIDSTKAWDCWADWEKYGSAGRSAIVVGKSAVMLSDHLCAAAFASTQEKMLRAYAQMRNFSVADLAKHYGFDRNWSRTYDFGNKTARVVIWNDFTLRLINSQTGSEMKAIPTRGVDAEKVRIAMNDIQPILDELEPFMWRKFDIPRG